MDDRKFPQGIRAFQASPKAPDFIIGDIVITPNALVQWLKDNPDLLTDYTRDGQTVKQMRLTLCRNKDSAGLNLQVNTYKGTTDNTPEGTHPKDTPEELPSELPF